MKVSELMQAMSDAGAPMEAILIAVRALEDKQAEIDGAEAEKAEKRARDAARKRAERSEARNVQGQSEDNPETVQETPSLSRPLSPQTPQTPTHTHPDNNTRARKGHRLPVDWEPKPLTADTAALVADWPDGEVQRELAKFRDWAAAATGANSRKSDWNAAWRNWLRRRNEEKPRNYRNDNPKPSGRNAAELARRNLGCH